MMMMAAAVVAATMKRLLPRIKRDGFVVLSLICIVALNLNLGFLHHGLLVANSSSSEQQQTNNHYHHRRSSSSSSSSTSQLDEQLLAFRVDSKGTSSNLRPANTSSKGRSTSSRSSTNDATFSACLLIKDDNDILNEWLAYHYYALDLRYLLVAVDPSSETSPTFILNRWRDLTDMQITEWTDTDFMPETFLKNGYHIHPKYLSGDANTSQWHNGHETPEQVVADTLVITNHRFRQVTFLSACLRHMRDRHHHHSTTTTTKSWTMHVDTDEYVTVNPLLRRTTQKNVQALNIRGPHEQSSVLTLLQQINRTKLFRSKANYPCISMPRLLFGSVELFANNNTNSSTTTTTTKQQQQQQQVVKGFNTTLFETLRWRYHTDFDDAERNAQPKVIVDVANVDRSDEMFHHAFSIHRPSKRLCRRVAQLNFTQLQRYPITANHYTGSWERYYKSKNDTRRSSRAYHAKAHVAAGYDDWLSPWLQGFVNVMGHDTAQQLLQDYTTITTTTH